MREIHTMYGNLSRGKCWGKWYENKKIPVGKFDWCEKNGGTLYVPMGAVFAAASLPRRRQRKGASFPLSSGQGEGPGRGRAIISTSGQGEGPGRGKKMTKLGKKTYDALSELGSIEDIIKRLKKKGIKGVPDNKEMCQIAQYIKKFL